MSQSYGFYIAPEVEAANIEQSMSPYEKKMYNATASIEEKMALVQRLGLKKEANIEGYRKGYITLSDDANNTPDADSGAIIDAETGQKFDFRTTNINNYDAVDYYKDVYGGEGKKGSRNKQRSQPKMVAELTGKRVEDLTPGDFLNVKNYQHEHWIDSLTNPNHTFTPYDRNRIYKGVDFSQNTRIPVMYKVTGTDFYNRNLVDLVSDATGKPVTFDAMQNPYLNVTNADYKNHDQNFDVFRAIASPNNIKRLQEFDAQEGKSPKLSGKRLERFSHAVEKADGNLNLGLTDKVDKYISEYENGRSFLGQMIDKFSYSATRSKESFSDMAERWSRHFTSSEPEKEYLQKLASDNSANLYSDFIDNDIARKLIYERSQKRIEQNIEQAAKDWDEGNTGDAAINLLKAIGEGITNLPEMLADSSAQTTAQMGASFIGAKAGAAIGTGVVPGLGTAIGGMIGGLLGFVAGSATIAADETMQTMDEYAKNNNGKRMSSGEILETFGQQFVVAAPDVILSKLGLQKALGKSRLGKVIFGEGEKITDRIGAGKALAAGTVGEGVQEWMQNTISSYHSQNEKNRKSWGEIATDPEQIAAGISGAIMGGALSGASTAIGNRVTKAAHDNLVKHIEEVQKADTESTPTGGAVNAESNKSFSTDVANTVVPTDEKGRLDTAKQLREKAANATDVSNQATDEALKKAHSAEMQTIIDAVKAGKKTDDIEQQLGKPKEEVFAEEVYYSNFNRIQREKQNKRMSESELKAEEKQLLKTASALGIDEATARKTIKEVAYDIKHGSAGYYSYRDRISALNKSLEDTNLDEKTRTKLEEERDSAIKGIVRLFANQQSKLEQLTDAVEEVALTGRDMDVQFRASTGAPYTVYAKDVANNRKGKGVRAVIDSIQEDLTNLANIMSEIDSDVLNKGIEDFNKSDYSRNTHIRFNNEEGNIGNTLARFNMAAVNTMSSSVKEQQEKDKGKTLNPQQVADTALQLVRSDNIDSSRNVAPNSDVGVQSKYTTQTAQVINAVSAMSDAEIKEAKNIISNSSKSEADKKAAIQKIDEAKQAGSDIAQLDKIKAKHKPTITANIDNLLSNTSIDSNAISDSNTLDVARNKFNTISKLKADIGDAISKLRRVADKKSSDDAKRMQDLAKLDEKVRQLYINNFTLLKDKQTKANVAELGKKIENIHDEKTMLKQHKPKRDAVTKFRGDNSFLSNMYEDSQNPIVIDGIAYKSAEAAFQAQKCKNPNDKKKFANLSAKQARQLGKTVALVDDWDKIKDKVMYNILKAKFTKELAYKLKKTGTAELIEGNDWGDRYWGAVANKDGTFSGVNVLGKLLMQIRDELNSSANVTPKPKQTTQTRAKARTEAKVKAKSASRTAPKSERIIKTKLAAKNGEEITISYKEVPRNSSQLDGVPSRTNRDYIVIANDITAKDLSLIKSIKDKLVANGIDYDNIIKNFTDKQAKDFILFHERRHQHQIEQSGDFTKYMNEDYAKTPITFEVRATLYALYKMGFVDAKKVREVNKIVTDEEEAANKQKAKSQATEKSSTNQSSEDIEDALQTLGEPFATTQERVAIYEKLLRNMNSLDTNTLKYVVETINGLMADLDKIVDFKELDKDTQREIRDTLEIDSNTFEERLEKLGRTSNKSSSETSSESPSIQITPEGKSRVSEQSTDAQKWSQLADRIEQLAEFINRHYAKGLGKEIQKAGTLPELLSFLRNRKTEFKLDSWENGEFISRTFDSVNDVPLEHIIESFLRSLNLINTSDKAIRRYTQLIVAKWNKLGNKFKDTQATEQVSEQPEVAEQSTDIATTISKLKDIANQSTNSFNLDDIAGLAANLSLLRDDLSLDDAITVNDLLQTIRSKMRTSDYDYKDLDKFNSYVKKFIAIRTSKAPSNNKTDEYFNNARYFLNENGERVINALGDNTLFTYNEANGEWRGTDWDNNKIEIEETRSNTLTRYWNALTHVKPLQAEEQLEPVEQEEPKEPPLEISDDVIAELAEFVEPTGNMSDVESSLTDALDSSNVDLEGIADRVKTSNQLTNNEELEESTLEVLDTNVATGSKSADEVHAELVEKYKDIISKKKEYAIRKTLTSNIVANTALPSRLLTLKMQGKFKYNFDENFRIATPECFLAIDENVDGYTLTDYEKKALSASIFDIEGAVKAGAISYPWSYLTQKFKHSNDTDSDSNACVLLANPHLRLLYKFLKKNNKTELSGSNFKGFELQEHIAKLVDFTLKEAIANGRLAQMTDVSSVSVEDMASLLGIPEEKLEVGSTSAFISKLFSEYGAPRATIADELGEAFMRNAGLKRNYADTNFAEDYARTVAGIGGFIIEYATALGIFTKIRYEKKEVSKETADELLEVENTNPIKAKELLCVKLNDLRTNKYAARLHSKEAKARLLALKIPNVHQSGPLYGKPHIISDKEQVFVKHSNNEVALTPDQVAVLNVLNNIPYETNDVLCERIDKNYDRIKVRLGWTTEKEQALMSLDDRESAKGRNLNIERSLDALLDAYKADSAHRQDADYKGMFFNNFFAINGRTHIDSSTANPQTDTLHRFLIVPKNAAKSLVFASEEQLFLERFALAQAFDVLGSEESHRALADNLFALNVDQLEQLMDALCDGDAQFTAKAKEFGFHKDKDKGGNGFELGVEQFTQTMTAVQHLIDRRKAKDEGKSSVKCRLLAETDGTTSGYANKMLQMPLDSIKEFMPKVGIFEGKNFESALEMHRMKKTQGFYDLYKTTAVEVDKILQSLKKDDYSQLKIRIAGEIASKVERRFESLKDKNGKPIAVTEDELNKMVDNYTDLMINIYKALEPSLPTVVQGEVSKYLRELMKDPTMVFGYSAGIASISRKIANNIGSATITKFMNIIAEGGVDNYLKSHTGEDAKSVKAIYKAMEEIAKVSNLKPTVLAANLRKNRYSETWIPVIRNEKLTNKSKAINLTLDGLFNRLISPTYGSAVGEVLTKEFSPFVEINDTEIQMSAVMYQMYKELYDRAITAARENSLSGMLTINDMNKIKEYLDGVLPYIQQYAGSDARILLMRFSKRFTATDSVSNKVLKNGELESSNVSSNILDPASPGRAAAVVPIHGRDSAAESGMAKECSPLGITCVFDASVSSALDTDKTVPSYNRNLISVNQNFNSFQNMLDNLNRVIDNYAKLTNTTRDKVLDNFKLNNYLNKVVTKETENGTEQATLRDFFEGYSTKISAVKGVVQLAEEIAKAREDFYNNPFQVGNMDGPDGTLVTARKLLDSDGQYEFTFMINKLMATLSGETKQSNPRGYQTDGAIQYTLEKSLDDVEARVGFLQDLDTLAKAEDNITCSQEHMEHLSDVIRGMKPEYLAGTVVKLANNGLYNAGAVNITKKEIEIVNDNKKNVDPVTRMAVESMQSPAEIYAHELVHLGLDYAFKHSGVFGFSSHINRLQKLQKEAMDILSWEDFMPDNYDASLKPLYERCAKETYNYIFTRTTNTNGKVDPLFSLNEFCAYATTCEKVRKKLAGKYAKAVEDYRSMNLADKVVAIVKNIFKVLFGGGKFSELFKTSYAVAKGESSVRQHELLKDLDKLIYDMYSANTKTYNRLLQHPMKLLENLYKTIWNVTKTANSYVSSKLTEFSTSLDNKAIQPLYKPINASTLEYGKMFVSALKLLPRSSYQRRAMRTALRTLFRVQQQGIIASFIRDVSQPDMQSSMLEALALRAKKADTISKDEETTVLRDLIEGFGNDKNVTKSLYTTALSNALLYTDAQCLFDGNNLDYVLDMLTNEQSLDNEIGNYKNTLLKQYGKLKGSYFINCAIGLARYMITGKGHENLNLNVDNVVDGMLTGRTDTKLDANHRDMLNKLATLIAIKNTKKDFRTVVASMNANGLKNFLTIHKEYVNEVYQGVPVEDIYGNSKIVVNVDKMHVVKGYTKQIFDPNIEMKQDLLSNAKELRKAGYELRYELTPNEVTNGPSMGVYTRPGFAHNTDGNAVVVTQLHSVGTSLKDLSYAAVDNNTIQDNKRKMLHDVYKGNADKVQERIRRRMMSGKEMSFSDFDSMSSGYTPVVGPNGVTDYRITMSRQSRRELLKVNEDAFTMLSKMYGSATRKASATEVNNIILDFIIKDANENKLPDSKRDAEGRRYVLLNTAASSDNKYLREMHKVIPPEFREYMKDHDLYVREDWLQYLFGVPSMSVLDTKWASKIPSYYVKRAIAVAEMIIKSFAYWAKQQIVFRIPAVLIGNIISNFNFHLMTEQNLGKIFKTTLANARAIRDYIDNKKAYNRIVLKERLGTATAEERNKKNWYLNKLRTNIVHPLMEKGMYQAIVEDVKIEDMNVVGKASRMLSENSLIDKIPNSLKWIGKNLYMTKGTAIYDFLFTATQYSDFIARATQYQLMMDRTNERYEDYVKKQKENKKPVMSFDTFKEGYERVVSTYITNAFINYDKPQSKFEQYLSDTGVIMFAKFAKRIQHVIFRELKERPISALLFLLTQKALLDTDDILEQNFISKHWSALYHTPLDNMINSLVPMPIQFYTGMRNAF